MRDLVEFNFEGFPGDGKDVEFDPRQISWPKQSQPKLSRLPILAGDLNRKLSGIAVGEKPEVVQDYRGEAPIMSAFYSWLEINEPDHGIDIDHPMEGHGLGYWPLWVHFGQTLLDKTGFSADVVFNHLYEEEMSLGEPQVWDTAFIMLYDACNGDDDMPLLEYLNEFVGWESKISLRFMPEFPQAVYELKGKNCKHSRIIEASRLAFRGVLLAGRIDLLDERWSTAIAGLNEYGKDDIYYTDWWDDAMLGIYGKAAEIDRLFEKLSRVKKMRDAVDPLVEEFNEDSEKCWTELLERLNVIAIEHPTLTETVRSKARPLVEVLA